MMSEIEKPDSHPDEETARAYIARTLPKEQTEQFEQHYFSCEGCWSRVQQALELREALHTGIGLKASARRPPAGWRTLVAAAAVLLVISVGMWTLSSRAPVLRGPGSGLDPTVSVVEGGVQVEWRAVDSADLYRIEIFTHDGALLFAEETPEPGLVLGVNQLRSAEQPDSLYLRIQALDRLRTLLASSPLVKIEGKVGAGPPRQ
jgi:hypothetical protein